MIVRRGNVALRVDLIGGIGKVIRLVHELPVLIPGQHVADFADLDLPQSLVVIVVFSDNIVIHAIGAAAADLIHTVRAQLKHDIVLAVVEIPMRTFDLNDAIFAQRQLFGGLHFSVGIGIESAGLCPGIAGFRVVHLHKGFMAVLGNVVKVERSVGNFNTLFWVPSALMHPANLGVVKDGRPRGIKRVFFCGEVMPNRQLNIWRRSLPDADFVNMYGPTEITDVCSWYRVDRAFEDGEPLPIGFPCENTRITLVEGEICVSGTCLSAGYYNAPEKTAAAFVQHPDARGIPERMYKTGDLGAYNERGELMFLGRKDSQIKKQGYRIELGEIECAIKACQAVTQGCCFYQAATQQIVCCYSGEDDEKALRGELKRRLPKYMLPDVYYHLPQFPQTMNGKIDRVRLRQELGL